jgi:hypothetical protein
MVILTHTPVSRNATSEFLRLFTSVHTQVGSNGDSSPSPVTRSLKIQQNLKHDSQLESHKTFMKQCKVEYSLCLQNNHHTMKMYGVVELLLHHSWTWHYKELSGQLHSPAAVTPGRKPLVPIALEAGCAPEPVWMLMGGGGLCVCQESNPCHPAHSYTDWAMSDPYEIQADYINCSNLSLCIYECVRVCAYECVLDW